MRTIMKKTLFPLLFLPLAALSSCGGGIPNQGEVDDFKALLSKQDNSPIYDKMFSCMFYQDYSSFAKNHGEEENETRFYSYRGGGAFGCLYEVSEEAYAEVEALESRDFFDYLSRGKGSYGLVQTADIVSYHYNVEEEEDAVETFKNQTFLQRVEANFGEANVQVNNSLACRDKTKDEYSQWQKFNGIIDKSLLFDTITVRAFSDIFARTNLYDGQRSCETLDRIYFKTLRELAGKSDRALSDFIIKNNIRIEEGEQATLVRFKVEDEELKAVLEENEIMPGSFEGTLSYDKDTGKFEAFEYKIAYLVDEANMEDGSTETTFMEFKAEGYSWNQKFGEDLYIEPNPTVYDNAEAFLEDVVREVIPPIF